MYIKELLSTFFDDAYRVGRVLAVAAVPVALLVTHVWYQTRITQLGYEISEETSRHEKLADRHRKLKIEAAVESRSGRLARRAKRRFELERLQPEQVITLEPELETPSASLDETEHAALEQGEGH